MEDSLQCHRQTATLHAYADATESLFQKPMLWSVSVVACTETDPGTSPRSADGASTESC